MLGDRSTSNYGRSKRKGKERKGKNVNSFAIESVNSVNGFSVSLFLLRGGCFGVIFSREGTCKCTMYICVMCKGRS